MNSCIVTFNINKDIIIQLFTLLIYFANYLEYRFIWNIITFKFCYPPHFITYSHI